MSDFFRAHKAVGTPVPTYFIESTAPDNVDDTALEPPVVLPALPLIVSALGFREIAAALAHGQIPNLVVMVHGFNNPEPAVLTTYRAAALAIATDPAIQRANGLPNGLVCIGYRWPSEKMGQPWRGTWDALPTLPTWFLYVGALFAILPFVLLDLAVGGGYRASDTSEAIDHLLTMGGLTFVGLVLTAALLRII